MRQLTDRIICAFPRRKGSGQRGKRQKHMEKLEIRRMEKEDLDEICAIEEEAFSMPWSRKNFEKAWSFLTRLFLTALYGGKPVGLLRKLSESGRG